MKNRQLKKAVKASAVALATKAGIPASVIEIKYDSRLRYAAVWDCRTTTNHGDEVENGFLGFAN